MTMRIRTGMPVDSPAMDADSWTARREANPPQIQDPPPVDPDDLNQHPLDEQHQPSDGPYSRQGRSGYRP
jgi:hypothetical protein